MGSSEKIRSIEGEMLFREGRQYEEQDALGKALESYQRAARLEPERPLLHFNIGKVLAKLGRWSEAVDAYGEALRLEPHNAEAHLNLAFIYYELGLDQRAQDEFQRARSLG